MRIGRRCFTRAAIALSLALFPSLTGCAKSQVVAGTSTVVGTGTDTTTMISLGTNTTVVPPPDAGSKPQTVECEGGTDCVCPPFNVAVIGKPGKWGANQGGDPDTALQEWLAGSSLGTAKVTNVTKRAALTADWLAGFNVIILASLSEDSTNGPWWTFTDAESAAFRAWVENGGGVITLTGYSSSVDEATAANQLIGFSGVQYNKDDVYASCPDWGICTCTKSLILSAWNKADSAIANLSNNITYIGFEHGRSITAPADAHVAATIDTTDGIKNVLVGKVVNGKGHVLAFGDEWITYTSQWTGAGNPMAADPGCAGKLPQDKYQTAQFWFNMIKWSSPGAACFKIVDTTTPVKIW